MRIICYGCRLSGSLPMKMKMMLFLAMLRLLCFAQVQAASDGTFHYYATVADDRHFTMLLQLIGSIHKVDFDHLDEIAVFDIGLTPEQKDRLARIEKTKVYAVEKVHPDTCTYFQTNAAGRDVRGWFSWKPVAMKQALDMFPYVLYLDAGNLVLQSPDDLFKHIKQNGYYVMHIPPFSIEERITKPVVDKVIAAFPKDEQEFLLRSDTVMIDAGFQGISREVYEKYVLPVYKLAGDLSLFADDGSAKLGFGAGRHDQTLFSIFAQAERLKMNCQGWTNLQVDGKAVPFHIHWDRAEISDHTCIYRSRGDCYFGGDKVPYIHWLKDWSILICTLQEREKQFQELHNKLMGQIREHHLEDRVEILSFKDNREAPVGVKRNALVRQSKADYINFIDDDDDVHDHYIKMIHDRLKSSPDCVSLVGIITFNGKSPTTFIHSIAYNSYFQSNGTYYRPPNHLNTMKRSIASQFLFPEISFGEDTDWAMQIARSGQLKKEEVVSEPYYFYKYVDK